MIVQNVKQSHQISEYRKLTFEVIIRIKTYKKHQLWKHHTSVNTAGLSLDRLHQIIELKTELTDSTWFKFATCQHLLWQVFIVLLSSPNKKGSLFVSILLLHLAIVILITSLFNNFNSIHFWSSKMVSHRNFCPFSWCCTVLFVEFYYICLTNTQNILTISVS